MKILTLLTGAAALAATVLSLGSCSDDRTYAELLNDEKYAVNNFLADYCVENAIPADTVFKTVAEYGDDAPYYRLDEDGNMYMQVVDAGTPGDTAVLNELIYFRFTRFSIETYEDGEFGYWEGNEEVVTGNHSFRYGNYELNSSYSYGTGIQTPLQYLPIDCQVNLVVKAAVGMPSEMSNVRPWLYRLRYYRPKS
ncbi:MAG: DUF4827 domain-containing protein [Bacteroides sp.]|nr:DUF4827 domain-containing protein [Bacteroides sp.]MCM1095197.1 DUF4827 domain-containing protein [Terasakiella sp.]